ncbi:MAG TPA: hypothetical protein PLC42_06055 [Parachlamydiaceae bacterium]|nr:hypothetical protein [Parachlamydiaceae bacterium]
MKALDLLSRFFLRFRYPISMPEDVATALGVPISNYITFKEFISCLASPSCKPTKLVKFMPREKAEEAFGKASLKEKFQNNTLISYCFSEGWVEFILHFDDNAKLRRIYLQHKWIEQDRGLEIELSKGA